MAAAIGLFVLVNERFLTLCRPSENVWAIAKGFK